MTGWTQSPPCFSLKKYEIGNSSLPFIILRAEAIIKRLWPCKALCWVAELVKWGAGNRLLLARYMLHPQQSHTLIQEKQNLNPEVKGHPPPTSPGIRSEAWSFYAVTNSTDWMYVRHTGHVQYMVLKICHQPDMVRISQFLISHACGLGSDSTGEVTSNSNLELPKFVLCFCQKLSGLIISATWMQQGKDSCRIFSRGLMESHLDPRMSTITVKPLLQTSSLQRKKTGWSQRLQLLPLGLLRIPLAARNAFHQLPDAQEGALH